MNNSFFDEIQKDGNLKANILKAPMPNPLRSEFSAMQTLKNFYVLPEEIKLFDVSNVADMVTDRAETKPMSMEAVPNIALPFQRMWLEFSVIREVHDRTASIMEKEMKKVVSKRRLEEIVERVKGTPLGTKIHVREGAYLESIRTDGGWNINGACFARSSKNFFTYNFRASALVDGSSAGNFEFSSFSTNINHETLVHSSGSVFVYMYAISLMHCKNIVIEEDGEIPALSRKHHRRNKGRRHHVLKIIPMKKVKAYQEKGASSLSKGDVSLHIRRGHFKTYTPEAPLFGIHSGTYWWESHTAGKAEVGTVTKDYQINPPGE
jgi:hypothetical protein